MIWREFSAGDELVLQAPREIRAFGPIAPRILPDDMAQTWNDNVDQEKGPPIPRPKEHS